MDPQLGQQADALEFLSALSREPYRYDFYQTLRKLECLYQDKPRWGMSPRPIDDAVRLGQDPELTFAPSALSSLQFQPEGRPPRLQVRLFGLLGPNGPLPIHFTEYARERLRRPGASDPTLVRFLDLFHHRFIALFYRAWAQAQPHVNRDRPRSDRFAVYVGAFVGLAVPEVRQRDDVPDLAKFFHTSTLVRQVRSAEGLRSILAQFFAVPVAIEEFVGHWLTIADHERTRLGRGGIPLGGGAVLGGRVWDHQSKFRIHLGPLTLAQYEAFLPASRSRQGQVSGGQLLRKLVDWVRLYLCYELDWDVRLSLARGEVPTLRLGGRGQLGWTTWLGQRTAASAAADLCLDGETFVERDLVA